MSTSTSKTFSSHLGFVAAAAGAAVGLGNIWFFPYAAGQYGGAAFLLLYSFMTLVLGLPMLMTEVAFGRRQQGGAYHALRNAQGLARHIGLASTLVTFSILSFYNVITGWILGYAWQMLRGIVLKQNDFGAFFQQFTAHVPSNLGYTGVVTLLLVSIIRAGVTQGIERWSKVLVPLFLIMFVGLIGYSSMLPHAQKGIAFYLLPRWQALTPGAVCAALSLSFTTLSLGAGVLTTYGAYLPRTANLPRSTSVVVGSVILISFLAGFLVFPLVFSQGLAPNQGPRLLFVSLPLVFQRLSAPWGTFVGVTFFCLMFFAALTSSISLLETVTRYTIERFGWSRRQATGSIALASYLLGIPSLLSFGGHAWLSACWMRQGVSQNFLDLMVLITWELGLPLVALCLSWHLARSWQRYHLADEIQRHCALPVGTLKYLYYVAQYLAPLLVGGVLFVALWELLY